MRGRARIRQSCCCGDGLAADLRTNCHFYAIKKGSPPPTNNIRYYIDYTSFRVLNNVFRQPPIFVETIKIEKRFFLRKNPARHRKTGIFNGRLRFFTVPLKETCFWRGRTRLGTTQAKTLRAFVRDGCWSNSPESETFLRLWFLTFSRRREYSSISPFIRFLTIFILFYLKEKKRPFWRHGTIPQRQHSPCFGAVENVRVHSCGSRPLIPRGNVVLGHSSEDWLTKMTLIPQITQLKTPPASSLDSA